ncbi:MAG: FkbM family methyltransferase [Hydrogenophaga sp.]|uniref:FkbM family methyltransferase n=1 Tax=Hydrogenophaga sp. TaxID=1904254 RepID=UPI0025B97327|nr:FkbM family methyltransferase [Hydrogenophaga sp.]MBT9551380.1 FkbM family methyltransferase [Hydrogenophaga sp.]
MKNTLSYHLPRLLHQLGRRVRFGNHQFKMPGYYPCRFTTSSDQHEGFLEAILRRVLETRRGTFIDVGVNAGQTLAKVLSIDKDRAYVGFEPQISCCFNADQFIKANGLVNAQVLPLALGDSNRLLSFFSEGETDECASLIDRKSLASNRTQTFVQCRMGDEILSEMGITQISAIKIDVEGAEIQVMEGLKETLTSQRPTIIFEVLPNFSGIEERIWHDPDTCTSNHASAEKIRVLLHQIGYQIFQIDEASASESKIDAFDLDNIKDFKGSNFIAHPIPM